MRLTRIPFICGSKAMSPASISFTLKVIALFFTSRIWQCLSFLPHYSLARTSLRQVKLIVTSLFRFFWEPCARLQVEQALSDSRGCKQSCRTDQSRLDLSHKPFLHANIDAPLYTSPALLQWPPARFFRSGSFTQRSSGPLSGIHSAHLPGNHSRR